MTCFETALRRYSTPGTAILSVVVGVTGVILFFHLAKGAAETIHEWLGMAFIVLAALHVVRHRGSFAQMLKQRHTQILAGAVALGIAAFVALVPPKPGNPMIRLARAAERAPISQLAPVIGSNAEDVLAKLGQAGITAHAHDTLAGLASANHTETARLVSVIMQPHQRTPAGN
jgi:hypothetical protein